MYGQTTGVVRSYSCLLHFYNHLSHIFFVNQTHTYIHAEKLVTS